MLWRRWSCSTRIGTPIRASTRRWEKPWHAAGTGLMPEVQHDLFEAAVLAEGEVRQPLAIYLHTKHPRTVETLQARAISEPDSLGG